MHTETAPPDVIAQMHEEGLLAEIGADAFEAFLARDGLQLLFFAGTKSVRREAHDVAVALRELLRSYRGELAAARIASDAEAELQPRCRVPATPCLVFTAGGEVLEVLPRVRDWGDYASVFHRYLGAPGTQRAAGGAS